MPTTAANEELPAGVLPGARVEGSVAAAASNRAYQRDAGRDSVIAAMPAAPMTPARWSEGPAPASGT